MLLLFGLIRQLIIITRHNALCVIVILNTDTFPTPVIMFSVFCNLFYYLILYQFLILQSDYIRHTYLQGTIIKLNCSSNFYAYFYNTHAPPAAPEYELTRAPSIILLLMQ